jgi:hypothetical protein
MDKAMAAALRQALRYLGHIPFPCGSFQRVAIGFAASNSFIQSSIAAFAFSIMFAIDAIREGGYDIYMVSDASGGTSVDAHKYAMDRMVQAGVVPTCSKRRSTSSSFPSQLSVCVPAPVCESRRRLPASFYKHPTSLRQRDDSMGEERR